VESFTLKIKTLTPIWTGDVSMKCPEIKTQSILGELRFWYTEALRCAGVKICSDKMCNHDHKKHPELNDICPVCKIFGCTGWKCRFDLRISGGKEAYRVNDVISPSGLRDRRDNPHAYRVSQRSGVEGSEICIVFKSAFGADSFKIPIALLKFLSHHAALGARTQWGYGVFSIISSASNDRFVNQESTREQSVTDLISLIRIYKPGLANLFVNYFFSEWTPNTLPKSIDECNKWMVINSKYNLRQIIRQHPECARCKTLRHEIFGAVRPDKFKSKICMSRVYQRNPNEMRIRVWGYVPKYLHFCPTHFSEQKTIFNAIRDKLTGVASECYWKEGI